MSYVLCSEIQGSVTIENKLIINQGVNTEATIGYKNMNRETFSQPVPIHRIKVEKDDVDYQDLNNEEYCGSPTSQDNVIDNIKAEGGDVDNHRMMSTEDDVDGRSTRTTEVFADFVKVEIVEETIIPDDLTNIDMMVRSTSPTDGALNSVKVENCDEMNQDGVRETASNACVKSETFETNSLASNRVRSHLKSHSEEEPLPDHHTSDAFISNVNFYFKINSDEKSLSCEICHIKFMRQYQLTSHMLVHSAIKSYSCEVCHMAFRVKYRLTNHMKTHSSETPFSCEICHKKFKLRCNVTNHMRVHYGTKPFSCKVCHKKFVHKGTLVCHMSIHSGEKPFSCEVCHSNFRVKGNLTAHMKIHAREKPFSCGVCYKTFSHKKSILHHLTKH